MGAFHVRAGLARPDAVDDPGEDGIDSTQMGDGFRGGNLHEGRKLVVGMEVDHSSRSSGVPTACTFNSGAVRPATRAFILKAPREEP